MYSVCASWSVVKWWDSSQYHHTPYISFSTPTLPARIFCITLQGAFYPVSCLCTGTQHGRKPLFIKPVEPCRRTGSAIWETTRIWIGMEKAIVNENLPEKLLKTWITIATKNLWPIFYSLDPDPRGFWCGFWIRICITNNAGPHHYCRMLHSVWWYCTLYVEPCISFVRALYHLLYSALHHYVCTLVPYIIMSSVSQSVKICSTFIEPCITLHSVLYLI